MTFLKLFPRLGYIFSKLGNIFSSHENTFSSLENSFIRRIFQLYLPYLHVFSLRVLHKGWGTLSHRTQNRIRLAEGESGDSEKESAIQKEIEGTLFHLLAVTAKMPRNAAPRPISAEIRPLPPPLRKQKPPVAGQLPPTTICRT